MQQQISRREGKEPTSPEENYWSENYALGRQQVGENVADLLLCKHEHREQGAPPMTASDIK